MHQVLCCIEQEFFLCPLLPPGDKKKGLANSTNGFLKMFLENSPYLEKKS
jgi:hypothetical protein